MGFWVCSAGQRSPIGGARPVQGAEIGWVEPPITPDKGASAVGGAPEVGNQPK